MASRRKRHRTSDSKYVLIGLLTGGAALIGLFALLGVFSDENSPRETKGRSAEGERLNQDDEKAQQIAEDDQSSPHPESRAQNELPEDYAFLGLTNAGQPVALREFFSAGLELTIQADGYEVLLDKGRDSVRGLLNRGLAIEQRGGKSVGRVKFLKDSPGMGLTPDRPDHYIIWTPEPIACYRDGKLLGIWDPAVRRLRPARLGQADMVISEPVGQPRDEQPGDRELPPLPEDFVFLPLTRVDQPRVLEEIDIPRPWTITTLSSGNEAVLDAEREARTDSVRGVRGNGLTIEQRNSGNVLSGTFKVRCLWTPEPIACYRDGKLLGIWDPAVKRLRPASSGEAKPLISVQDDKP